MMALESSLQQVMQAHWLCHVCYQDACMRTCCSCHAPVRSSADCRHALLNNYFVRPNSPGEVSLPTEGPCT